MYDLDLIPVKKPATFHISVSGGGAAELAVSVRGPHGELPVRIKGDVQSGFNAEFTPTTVGAHTINVEYNGYAVQVRKRTFTFYKCDAYIFCFGFGFEFGLVWCTMTSFEFKLKR